MANRIHNYEQEEILSSKERRPKKTLKDSRSLEGDKDEEADYPELYSRQGSDARSHQAVSEHSGESEGEDDEDGSGDLSDDRPNDMNVSEVIHQTQHKKT